jgi:hypothetical protein
MFKLTFLIVRRYIRVTGFRFQLFNTIMDGKFLLTITGLGIGINVILRVEQVICDILYLVCTKSLARNHVGRELRIER